MFTTISEVNNMVKCENCAHAKCIAAGKRWYCEITGDNSNRGAGDGEIVFGETKFTRVNPKEDVRCDHFE
jgi:hypothetical protein